MRSLLHGRPAPESLNEDAAKELGQVAIEKNEWISSCSPEAEGK